ncbi:MAG: WD40 repeat domain-containing protein, partial [Gemmataceae bacterium]
RLVLPHEDGSLYLADMRTGKELLAFEMSPNSTRNGPPRVTISPNEGAIEETRFEIKRNPNGKSPRFNEPDNLKLSCWRWKTNRVKQQIVAKTSKVYDEFVRSPNGRRGQNYSGITYSADGRCVAMPDKRICIREVATGKDRLQLSLPKQSYTGRADLALSPDGRFLACSCYGDNVGNVFVFSTSTGKLLARWRAKHGTCEAVAFSRDGRMLATGGYDGTILVWKIPENDDLPGVLSEEETATFWQALDSDDAARANRALAGLAAAPSQAVPLIQKRFPTTWKNLDRKQIARWIAELDDDSFQAREQATRELRRVGSDAAAALREALTKAPSPEAKRRIKGILNLLSKGNRPKYLRELRAIEVLERIGTPQAKDVLRSLAGKKLPPDLGEEVQASLRRLGDKP